jgi:hypothetical protein
MTLDLQIPEVEAQLLATEYADLPPAAVEALALEGYRSSRFSDRQLRQILGFSSRMQVHAFLKEHEVHLHYSFADLEQDRETSLSFETESQSISRCLQINGSLTPEPYDRANTSVQSSLSRG